MKFSLVGFRTIIIGLLVAIGPSALQYLGAVDWTRLGISPAMSAAIAAVIFVGMRFISKTPVFKQDAVGAVASMPDEALRQAGVAKMLVENNPVGKLLAEKTPGDVVQMVGQATAGYGRRA